MIKIGQLNLKQSATLLKYLVPGLQLELTSIIWEGQKEGKNKYTEAIVQSLRNNGLSIWCFDGLFSSKCDTFFIVDKI